jgi:hypothetical protein
MAEATSITSRFFGIEQAARALGDQETEFCLIEGTLPAWQREGFLQFEELDRFREGLLLRGVHRDHLDAVRAAVQGAPIPRYCWRRWFAMDIVNLETGTVVLQFPGYRHAVVFQPQVQSADVLQHQARTANKSDPAVEIRPAPPDPPPQMTATEAATKTPAKTWIKNEIEHLKAEEAKDKFRFPKTITEFARLLEGRMLEAAKIDKSINPLKWSSIRTRLTEWELWPIS